jgi:hypothetical protein
MHLIDMMYAFLCHRKVSASAKSYFCAYLAHVPMPFSAKTCSYACLAA